MNGTEYQLGAVIGVGGMGTVYRARNRLTGEEVALKKIRLGAVARDEDTSAQHLRLALTREFQTLASLRHPNVINVLDYGFDEERQPFFTMELLEEPRSLLEAAKCASLVEKAQLLVALLRAIGYLHRRRVLHCDLKPPNVLVSRDQLKVVDFGIAVGTHGDRGFFAGTPEYTAPELFFGEAPTAASDLYSIGVIAYQLFTGKFPFVFDDVNTFLESVLGDRAGETTSGPMMALVAERFRVGIMDIAPRASDGERPSEHWQDVDDRLRPVVETLCARRPEARFTTAAEAIAAIHALLDPTAPLETPETQESFLQAAEFVGRTAELEALRQALDGAIRSTGSAWLVGGESGVGKTRLLGELRVQALVKGVATLRGQATAESGNLRQVWVPVLRALLVRGSVSDGVASALKELVPDVDELVGRTIPAAPPATPQVAQERLVDAVQQLLAAQRAPVVLVFDDLQWAENDTLTLLDRVRATLATAPVLAIGSYRDEQRPDLPARLPGFATVRLARLSREQVTELASSMLGEAAKRPAVVDYIQRETEGNVFFVIEVVRAVIEESGFSRLGASGDLPHILTGGMEAILSRRLNRMPARDQPLLRLAAVGGRQIDTAVLNALSDGVDVQTWLLEGLDAAVFEVHEGRWAFSHDKLREHLLAGLAAGDLRAMHLRLAETIEDRYRGRPEQDPILAHHYLKAEAWEKAFLYSVRAGEAADRFFDLATARIQYENALVALGRLPPGVTRDRRRIDTLIKYVAAACFAIKPQETLGRMSEAAALLAAIPGAEREERDDLRDAHIAYWTGYGHFAGADPPQAIAHFRRALPLAQRGNDMGLRLRLALSTVRALTTQGKVREELQIISETLEPLERMGAWAEWSRLKANQGFALCAQGRYTEGRRCFEAGIARARELKNQEVEANVRILLGNVSTFAEDWPTVASEAELVCDLSSLEKIYVWVATYLAEWAYSHLDPARARQLGDRLQAVSATMGKLLAFQWRAASLIEVHRNLGERAEALAQVGVALEAARQSDSIHMAYLARRFHADLLATEASPDWDEVHRLFGESLRVHEAEGHHLLAARTRLHWGEAFERQGDLARARELRQEGIALLTSYGAPMVPAG